MEIFKRYSEKHNRDMWYVEVDGEFYCHGPFKHERLAKEFAENEL